MLCRVRFRVILSGFRDGTGKIEPTIDYDDRPRTPAPRARIAHDIPARAVPTRATSSHLDKFVTLCRIWSNYSQALFQKFKVDLNSIAHGVSQPLTRSNTSQFAQFHSKMGTLHQTAACPRTKSSKYPAQHSSRPIPSHRSVDDKVGDKRKGRAGFTAPTPIPRRHRTQPNAACDVACRQPACDQPNQG